LENNRLPDWADRLAGAASLYAVMGSISASPMASSS
jgi:hypothetical protein